MKRQTLAVLLLTVSLVSSSCVRGQLFTPTMISTQTPAIAPTKTSVPTRTRLPTSTPQPTATPIPSLPDTVELTFDDSIPEHARDIVRVTVNQAYWYYVGLGCSPAGFEFESRVDNNGGEAKVGFAYSSIEKIETEQSMTTGPISHELAHVMCQLAFTKKSNMGAVDLIWLTEGVAMYFSTMEQIADTGMNMGVPFERLNEQTLGMAESASRDFCQIPLQQLEHRNARVVYSDGFGYVAHIATVLLIKTTPDGVAAVIQYYTLLADTPKYDAFQQAFGRTTAEFYKQYETECPISFPSTRE